MDDSELELLILKALRLHIDEDVRDLRELLLADPERAPNLRLRLLVS